MKKCIISLECFSFEAESVIINRVNADDRCGDISVIIAKDIEKPLSYRIGGNHEEKKVLSSEG